ncbi:MAG: phosphotransferase [Gammaproteobacteria bacterium]
MKIRAPGIMLCTVSNAAETLSPPRKAAIAGLVAKHFGPMPQGIRRLGRGLINQTFLLEFDAGERRVLQAVNPLFPAGVNEDIDAATRFLDSKGLRTPRLIRTRSGSASVTQDGEVWRLLSWVPGLSLDMLGGTGQAREAGALLGRFHSALVGFKHRFRQPRLGVHDTQAHLNNLRQATQLSQAHRHMRKIRPLAEEILDLAATLPALPETPDRVVHGDPKINNILFDDNGIKALCLVDLDTLGLMPLPLEMGDAMRSWCNAAGEDSTDARFSADLFEAAIIAYASETGDWITEPEWQTIVLATRTILIELATRFCADAVQESYFGWDPQVYASRSEHNQVRARGQLSAFHACSAQHKRLEEIVRHAFQGGKA